MKKHIEVTVHYYGWKWRRGKLVLDLRKLQRESFKCKSIEVIDNGRRLSFRLKDYSTNIDGRQIKKLVIKNNFLP